MDVAIDVFQYIFNFNFNVDRDDLFLFAAVMITAVGESCVNS
jgi:hypothetical protein